MTCYEELKARGLIAQVTNEEEISKMINEGKAVFYHETVGTLALAGAATVIVGVVGYNVIRARQSTESSVSSNFSE